MLVPPAMEQLHEAHTALAQPSRHQAVPRERPRLASFFAVEIERTGGLVREIGQLGHRGLHAKRHLVLRDSRRDFGIARVAQLELVQGGEIVEQAASHGGASIPGGFDRNSTGSPCERNLTPA